VFDRVGGRLFLTGAGEQLLGSCRSLLGSVAALGEQAEQLRRGDAGVLRVAASPVQMETVFSTFLHQYTKRYPNVQVKLIEAIGTRTRSLLERGEIHLGISLLQSLQADESHFGIYPVPPVELVAAYAVPSPLEGNETVDIRRLAAMPLLLLDSGFVMRKTFDAACRHAGVTSNIVFESAVAHNLLAFAEAGLGVAVVPSVVQTHRYRLRRSRITQDSKPLTEPLAIFWDKRRELPRYISDFCEALSGHMRELSSVTHAPTGKSGRSNSRRGPSRSRAR
jgi:DNA-binding transcriptional LysR family regulator